jgi:murein DD-endopeptidase MepM/ murein hydrolase activator NlpD
MIPRAALLALVLTAIGAVPARADDTPAPSPTPSAPSPRPSAPPSPSASPGGSPSASPTASASPSSSGSPSPSASASAAPADATPSASASPSLDETAQLEAARARDAELLASAKTLSQLIDAQALVARDELTALAAEIVSVQKDLEEVEGDIARLETLSRDRHGNRDRLQRDALRLLSLGDPSLVTLSDVQREALDDLRRLDTALRESRARLADRVEELGRVRETAAVKQAQIQRLRDRGRISASAAAAGDSEKRAAEVALLQALARDATVAQTALAQLVVNAMAPSGDAPSAWVMPTRGVITQAFGPTAFQLALPRNYRGATYPHFHDALDIAAPLGTPVVAAAEGRVTFVGHLPDGAMVVIVSHAGGLVSVYAHLDDTFARPPVRIGDTVKGGQVIGFVGVTGITTGPHLHFSVLRDGEPIDPISLLGGR